MQKHKITTETYVHVHAAASKALTTLRGLILGVNCDKILNDFERTKLVDWIDAHLQFQNHPAMGSVLDYLAEVLSDSVLTLEESEDIQWMIDRNLKSFYDESTQKIQTLHGLLSGIAADREVNDTELKFLWAWLNDNDDLKGIFPYDEIYSVVLQVGTKKVLTTKEKTFLLNIFHWADDISVRVDNPLVPWAVDPEIIFEQKSFCITGISKIMSRQKLSQLIGSKKGTLANNISKKLDYLIVCAEANVAWAHACYGRKVEQAIKLRRDGGKVIIIAEKDLWDALKD